MILQRRQIFKALGKQVDTEDFHSIAWMIISVKVTIYLQDRTNTKVSKYQSFHNADDN